MARHGDAGPYSAANVSIQTNTQNSRDGIKRARAGMESAIRRGDHLGRGRGWTIRPDRSSTRPYQVMLGSAYVGSFTTQDEAEAAYRQAVLEERRRRHQQTIGDTPANRKGQNVRPIRSPNRGEFHAGTHQSRGCA
jgi:hypothetical protein